MEKYRNLIISISGFDPFTNDITLASVCLRDFTLNHLKTHSMGIIPPKGYFICSNQSAKALDFLGYKSWELKAPIVTSQDKTSEFKIGNYLMDGVCHQKKKVFDFHGCYFHGCQQCFSHID